MGLQAKDELALLSMLIPLDAADWNRVRDYVDSRMAEPARRDDVRLMESITPSARRRATLARYRTRTQDEIKQDQARVDAELSRRTQPFRVGDLAKRLRISTGMLIKNLNSAKARGLVTRTGTRGPSSLWHPKGKA